MPHAGRDGPGVGIQPLERGQKRGVNVDQPVAPALHECRREHAHEACEADQLHAALLQRSAQRPLEIRPRAVVPVIDHAMRQTGLCGAREPEGAGPVGEYERDLARGIGAGAIVDEGLQIGPAARDQDAYLQPRHVALRRRPATVPCPPPVVLLLAP